MELIDLPHRKARLRNHSGMALIMVLVILVLVTAVVVALLSLTASERSSANSALQRTQAGALADAASDLAMGTITDAITQGSQRNASWASEPGRIWIFDIEPTTGEMSHRSVDLFSALPHADPDNVDLNRPSMKGEYPIAPPAPNQTTANMKVGWVNVLADPTQPATKANPIIGRIAYWVDDESCKVNLNTADGSQRVNTTLTPTALATTASTQKVSFGFGTPSEISLAALPGLDQTKAAAIADYAWQQEFSSDDEITRAQVSGGTAAVTRAMFNALRFDVTHYNCSPDVNFMGEPRIQLLPRPSDATASAARQNTLLGPYLKTETLSAATSPQGVTLDAPYPQPSQLPMPGGLLAADRFFLHTFANGPLTQRLQLTENDYYVGKLIANYLKGINLHPAGQNTFVWPKFTGAESGGFVGKYTPRQLDSITLQILDTAGKIPLADQYVDGGPHNSGWTRPSILTRGWLSDEVVMGVGRGPKVTELLLSLTVTPGDPLGYGNKIGNASYAYPCVLIQLDTEYYIPKGYGGVPLNAPFTQDPINWRWYPDKIFSATDTMATMNLYDWPERTPDPGNPQTKIGISGASKFGTLWGDSMLTALKPDGTSAGLDFAGCPSDWDDPDQPRAAAQHPYAQRFTGSGTPASPYVPTGVYGGASGSGSNLIGAWMTYNNIWYSPTGTPYLRFPGCYLTNNNIYGTRLRPIDPTATSIRLVGGLAYASGYSNSAFTHGLITPLDSFEQEFLNKKNSYVGDVDGNGKAIIAKVNESLIPVDVTLATTSADYHRLLLSVEDPLVNQFPADWKSTLDPANADLTLKTGAANYAKGGKAGFDPFFVPTPAVTKVFNSLDGDNLGFRPSGGGDPLSVWLPNLDTRIPKQARFPSVGALFSIRTGLFPDIDVVKLPKPQQHGAPFRGLNMAPSSASSQATEGGKSYPDWAMLDLFNVPFLPQKPCYVGDAEKPFRRLTYGGATIGRMNINNPETPYPFGETVSNVTQTPPKRNALKALFLGLTPSNSYDATGEPVFTTIDATESAAIAKSVSDYQKSNGPFLMAGEIANVPEVAKYLYTGPPGTGLQARHPLSVSRNDVVRDTVGTITTRSNVYSVWVVAQTIQKGLNNGNYGLFEAGDRVTSEVRRRYLIERFIETGKDAVPGNAVAPTVTDTPNAYSLAKRNGDDVDAVYHPTLTYPLAYRWRVVSVENFSL